MSNVKPTAPLISENSFELTNAVMFALGVQTKYIESSHRNTAVLRVHELLQDNDLRALRVLNVVRCIVLKQYNKLILVSDFEDKSFRELLDFPSFVLQAPCEETNILDIRGNILQRVSKLNSEIMRHSLAIRKYIRCDEEHPEYFVDMFGFPKFSTYSELALVIKDFTQNIQSYPFRVWVNYRPSPVMLNSDYLLAFTVYKQHDDVLKSVEPYKVIRSTSKAKANYDTLYGSTQALSFLKSVLAEPTDRRVALIDTQNMNAAAVYEFFNWVRLEYGDVFEDVYLFVDGTEWWSWNIAETQIGSSVQRVYCERVKDSKSIVDTKLIALASQLYYTNTPTTFFIFSSDCDFIPLASLLPNSWFCFCGMSGGSSIKSIQSLESQDNATFIVIDEFLGCIDAQHRGRNQVVDEVAACLNKRKIDAKSLLDDVSAVCQQLGRRNDPVITSSMLNYIFSSFHVRVAADGCLQFKPPWEHWAWQ